MDDDAKIQRLREIAGRFFDLDDRTILELGGPPFDISKPNLHDSKAEFLAELAYVDGILTNLRNVDGSLRSAFREGDDQHDTAQAVARIVDERASRTVVRRRVLYPSDLVVLAAAKSGLTLNAILVISELVLGLSERKQELESQRDIYWSGKGRAPNHYARAIALRFAKLIAKNTGQRPTFGTSRDGDHPSTEYGRALEEIFDVLDITATVKHPATWALDQITDEDLKPETKFGLLGALLAGRTVAPDPINALADNNDQSAKPGDR